MAILPGVTFVNLLPKSYLSVLRSSDYVRMDDVQRQKFPLSFKLFVLMLPPSPSANQLPNKWKIVQLKGSFCVWIDVRDVSIALKDFHISRRLFLTTYLVKRKRKRIERAIRHRRQRRARAPAIGLSSRRLPVRRASLPGVPVLWWCTPRLRSAVMWNLITKSKKYVRLQRSSAPPKRD